MIAACALAPIAADAQTANNLAALKGLAPFATLPNSPAGQAALAANFAVTGGVQTGLLRRPTLSALRRPAAAGAERRLHHRRRSRRSRRRAWNDARRRLCRARPLSRPRAFHQCVASVADVVAYALATSGADSNSGKYFFANATTDGKTPVSDQAAAILKDENGATDVFGIAYGRPRGGPGADAFGDSRPFQTEPSFAAIAGPDYFNVPADNVVYNRGPAMNLSDSPSFPSGHTTYGYTGALLLALLTPERYPRMIARGAEYGDDRIIVGAHYAMDVIAGRTLATYDVAHLSPTIPPMSARR